MLYTGIYRASKYVDNRIIATISNGRMSFENIKFVYIYEMSLKSLRFLLYNVNFGVSGKSVYKPCSTSFPNEPFLLFST